MAEHSYAFIFGKPGEGAHSRRFFGFAFVDLIGTVLLAILVTYIWDVPLWKSIVGMFILGEVLHYLFGSQTAFLTTLGVRIKN
jgi:hypothetical protein